MNTLDLVKAAKSATGDFADFWKNFVEFAQNLPKLFTTFGKWGADALGNGKVDSAKGINEQYKDNTTKVFEDAKAAREAAKAARKN
ncbi:hypothetical protein [Corynebacterium bouchesdurhonense]|uniref:hypothetical protein n=1 Tax=Corynebacterium bouchesdurhonense TaxID=1720192 RepID=UPI00082CC16D|nr:hypothetical protein [Corynebacterium bouchesdurhonense]